MNVRIIQFKRAAKIVLLTLLLSAIGMTKGYAYDFSAVCSSGQTLYYNITDVTNHYVELTYPGVEYWNGWSGFIEPSGNVILPESLPYNGGVYTITSIGNYTFYGCQMLNSITISNSVTSIGDDAFYSCRSLTSIELPNSVTTIGNNAFGWSSLTSIELPNSVTTICGCAFFHCNGLTSIEIPNSVTSIGSYAFYYCTSFTGSLTIPNSITAIGDYAFGSCRGLGSIYILPETPPALGSDVFYEVSPSIPVYIPCDAVEAYQTVNGLSGFTNLIGLCSGEVAVVANPSDGGTVIGAGNYSGGDICVLTATPNPGFVFENWTENGIVVSTDSVYSFYAHPTTMVANFSSNDPITFADADVKALCVTNWDTNGDGELSYTEAAAVTDLGGVFLYSSITSFNELRYFIGLTSIGGSGFTAEGSSAFCYCDNLTSIEIPSSVISIGSYAFGYCTSLTSIELPNSVASIGFGAFHGSGLTSIEIPNSVTNIEQQAFSGCSNLTSIEIPRSVNLIGPNAFSGCIGLEQITVAPDNTTYDSRENCNAIVRTNTNTLISGCKNTIIPNSVTKIDDYAFFNCSGLTSLEIPNSVTMIGFRVFAGCGGLEQIIVESGNPAYDSRENCNALIETATNALLAGCHNTVIPNSVTSIGEEAFRDCSGFMDGLTIPNSVTSIGQQAFFNCPGFTGSLTIGNSVTTIGRQAFCYCSGFTGSLTIPDSVTSIGESAFYGCLGFTGTLTLGNSLETIGVGAFHGGLFLSDGLNFTGSLTIPNSVTSIGDYAFAGCEGFTGNLIIPNSVSSINYGVFAFCSGFTGSLTIPNSVTLIGDYAFHYCSGITSIEIPSSVTSIGMYAFCGCSGLTTMTAYPVMPPALGTNVFELVPTTIPVNVPCESLSAYQNASGWDGFTNYNYILGTVCDSGEITVTANPYEGGIVTGAGYYEGGATCTLVATANPGYTFYNWTESGTMVSYDSNYSFIVAGDRNLVANFVEGDLCAVTFDLYDSFGDGYTGNYLVISYGDVTEQLTVESGSFASHMLFIPNGSHVSLTWISGSYPEDCSFTVSYLSGDAIYHGENLNVDFMYEFDVDCVGSSDITQTVNLSQGWNWWSTYIEQEGIDGLTMLEESLGANGHQIKSQTDFVTNYGSMWFGMLGSIDNEETYMIDNTSSCQVVMTGAPVTPSDHPITVSSGWNWIGYPCTNTMSVSEAFAGYTPANGDQVKSQSDYAMYFSGMWIGQLQSIAPGTGLMYLSNNATPTTLVYPDGGRSTETPASSKAMHWTNDIHAYPHNMTVMAVVELDDVELTTDNYELSAFDANGECRGSAKLVYVEPLDRHVAFLTIAGDDAVELSFRLFDAENGIEYADAEETLSYTVNAIVGDVDDLYVVHFRGTTGMDEFANSIQIFPNPVQAGDRISINTVDEAKSPVRVEIVNAMGVETLRATSVQTPAMLTAPSAVGVYTMRITVEGKGTVVRKLVVK